MIRIHNKTYNGVSSIFASASLGICLGSPDPSVGAPSINEKRVYNRLASISGSVNGSHTMSCRTANSNLSGVSHSGVRDAESLAVSPPMISTFESLYTSAVLFDNVERTTLVNPRGKAESKLPCAATDGARIYNN